MRYERQDTKRLGKHKQFPAWTIYLWRNGDKYEGAAGVITKDGVKEIYCYGWNIEPTPGAKRNEDKHQAWQAKTNVKNTLNQTMNVINWYGKGVLDSKGNIDPVKFQVLEANTALSAVKANDHIDKLNHKNKDNKKWKKLDNIGFDDFLPFKKFPIKEITLEEAGEYKFK